MNTLFDSLIADAISEYSTATEGGDHDVVILRRNGCLWPSDTEVLRLFDILHKRVVYNKLEGQEQWQLVGSDYAVTQMIQGTPMADLPVGHLRMYWEFGGFLPARELLKLGGFIESRNQGFMQVTIKSINWLQQGGSDFPMILMEDLSRHAHKLERFLMDRVKRYELIPHMMRLMYRCTREGNYINASPPLAFTALTRDKIFSEEPESL